MRLPPLRQLLVCLALMSVTSGVMATDLRHPAATEPTESAAVASDRLDDPDLDSIAASHTPRLPRPRAPQATPPARSNGDRTLPSRFHSFLPGMFR
jgi:hypothetical protein